MRNWYVHVCTFSHRSTAFTVAMLLRQSFLKLLMDTAMLRSGEQSSLTRVACKMAFSATAWLVKQTLGSGMGFMVMAGGTSSNGNMTVLVAVLPQASAAASVTVDLSHAGAIAIVENIVVDDTTMLSTCHPRKLLEKGSTVSN